MIDEQEFEKTQAEYELCQKRDQFLDFIKRHSPLCGGDFMMAVQVARHCYALLLMEMPRIRTEFAKQDYLDVLGDTRIFQKALLMQAGILSGDKPLKRMAGYTDLECVAALTPAAASRLLKNQPTES